MKRLLQWALVIFGIICLVLAAKETVLAGTAKAEPQTITCAALGMNGPGDNTHVVMTDFVLPPSWVFEEEKVGGGWAKIWNPAVPNTGFYPVALQAAVEAERETLPLPNKFSVIVLSEKVDDEAELDELAGQESIQGVIVNDVRSLGLDEKKILEEGYPETDFERCWILEHGATPSGPLELALGYLLGVVLVLAGLIWWWRGRSD